MNFDESIAYGKNVSALIDFCKNMELRCSLLTI